LDLEEEGEAVSPEVGSKRAADIPMKFANTGSRVDFSGDVFGRK
jgi:hypothetical protein